ncbi:hypothetical protein FE810_11400 [Thalassotalea litorea]|uniref:DUF3192 domain-containing protein n=1 Tax=Thalassotalea litorea TaxID=2020715 RepID=A0A5R9IN51_9GAMM|nr:hypothetical protein [Thalassotalea litorea]TLU64681.1 hypothetical protein FE810_11400 [Thalassotalea litorea]
MLKRIALLSTLLLLSACSLEEEATALSANGQQPKIWVFTQFNVPEEGDEIESYYYYAQVSKAIYQKIGDNQLNSGFILLENVKYWGDGDLIHDYKDIENSGELVFRIEDIAKIDRVNSEPQVGLGYEQFEEPAKKSRVEANTHSDEDNDENPQTDVDTSTRIESE